MTRLANELERHRREQLTRGLARTLRRDRSVTVSTSTLEDVALWRGAARAAGRRLGIQIRTGVSRDGRKVWASEGP